MGHQGTAITKKQRKKRTRISLGLPINPNTHCCLHAANIPSTTCAIETSMGDKQTWQQIEPGILRPLKLQLKTSFAPSTRKVEALSYTLVKLQNTSNTKFISLRLLSEITFFKMIKIFS